MRPDLPQIQRRAVVQLPAKQSQRQRLGDSRRMSRAVLLPALRGHTLLLLLLLTDRTHFGDVGMRCSDRRQCPGVHGAGRSPAALSAALRVICLARG